MRELSDSKVNFYGREVWMKKNYKKLVSDLVFYGILFSMVFATVSICGSGTSAPRMVGRYSAFVVLTGSMEEVIPKGSLVMTKHVEVEELKVGDDITYMVSEAATVTHRIVEIEENYLDTGTRGFRTQGVMNSEPDLNFVAAVNVVGKVIWHNKTLGIVVSFGQRNWPLLIFFIVVLFGFVKLVESILRKETVETDGIEKTRFIGEDEFEIIEL